MTFFHPADLSLSLFISDDLAPRSRRRVAAHLGRCEKCFAYVAAMRSTAAIAAGLPAPARSENGISRIHASRETGERMLLPSVAGDLPGPTRQWAWQIAAAAVLLGAIAIFSSAPELSAVAVESELILAPATPRAGDTVRVAYRPTPSVFRDEDQLVLSARARTAIGTAWGHLGRSVIVLDTLVRDRAGVFRGAFTLPVSVVFARLTVEDGAASTVDNRDDLPWEVVTHGPDGKPTFDALVQRENDYMGRSWEVAYATARRKAQLYPLQIRSWSTLEFFERRILGEASTDSAHRDRRELIDSIVAGYEAAPAVPPDELGELLNRARRLNDSAGTSYWWTRLQREAPRHPRAVEHATLLVLLGDHGGLKAPDSLLVKLEDLWRVYGPVHSSGRVLLQAALGAAWHINDAKAYRRWALRAIDETPASARYYATNFLRHTETRSEGLTILRDQLVVLDKRVRPLGWTKETHIRSTQAERRRIFAAIGRGLLESGNQRGGLDTLALAVNGGWDLALFQDVAAGRMKAGDTEGALAIHAKIAADPRTPAAQRDSLAKLAVPAFGPTAWTGMVAEARQLMIQTTMAASEIRLVPGEPRLTDGAGQPVRLRELIANKPALVVFWSRFCGPALEALPRIDSVAAVLRLEGATAFLVVDEPPSPALTAFLKEHKVSTPVFYDTRREASNAFRNFGTPAYYVLDRASRLRFTWASTEDELLVQVAAVREELPHP